MSNSTLAQFERWANQLQSEVTQAKELGLGLPIIDEVEAELSTVQKYIAKYHQMQALFAEVLS